MIRTKKGKTLAWTLHRDIPAPLGMDRAEKLLSLLLRHAATVQRLAVEACNRELTSAEQRRDKTAQRRIGHVCSELGWRVKFGGDPRGYVVKLLLPSGRYNTWGGQEEGWGVA